MLAIVQGVCEMLCVCAYAHALARIGKNMIPLFVSLHVSLCLCLLILLSFSFSSLSSWGLGAKVKGETASEDVGWRRGLPL